MKARTGIIAAIACAALLSSCGPFGSRVAGLAKAAKGDPRAEALAEKVKGYANLAASMGWPKPKAVAEYLPDTDAGLGYKVAMAKDGKPVGTELAWSASARDKLLKAAAKKGYSASFEPIWHCRPYADRASPLPSAALAWNDAQLAEWLVWEWAASRLKPKSDSDAAYRAATYLSYKAGQALLIKALGPGSQELARWQEGVWDRRTFQTLAADLKGQVEGIVAAHPDPKDRDETLRRIVGFWIKDFRSNYPKRFITNAHVAFGRDGDWVEPAALYAMDWGCLGWQDWEKAYPGPAEKLGELMAGVRK